MSVIIDMEYMLCKLYVKKSRKSQMLKKITTIFAFRASYVVVA